MVARAMGRFVVVFVVAVAVSASLAMFHAGTGTAEAKPAPCVEMLPDGSYVHFFNPLNPCPGPPASIGILVPFDSTTCASVEAVTITVVDKDDYDVDDGTPVSVTTSLGTALSGQTFGGRYVASLLMPRQSVGVAELSVSAGNVSQGKTIQVTCG
jgi:hypothetical protein